MKRERAPNGGENLDREKGGVRGGEAGQPDETAAATAAAPSKELEHHQPDNDEGQGSGKKSLAAGTALSKEFEFQGRSIRTFLKGGGTWFAVPDVCAVLEHTNSRMAVGRLEDDERDVISVYTLGGDQEINVVNESGLYSLIFTSRKPEAKAFRRWVTGEVLPAIRKTGHYEGAFGQPSAALDGEGKTHIALPPEGRFIVTMRGGGATHIHNTGYYDAIWRTVDATDCRLLC